MLSIYIQYFCESPAVNIVASCCLLAHEVKVFVGVGIIEYFARYYLCPCCNSNNLHKLLICINNQLNGIHLLIYVYLRSFP